MAATANAGHNEHIRGTLKVSFYLYLPVYMTIILLLNQKGNEDQFYCTVIGREASASLPQTDLS
jgi:hypothetical protein